jgi:CheY-like chemotaxis protein
MIDREGFRVQLRSALNHLYDPDYLRQCPLAASFAVPDRFDRPTVLQRILTEAIQSLQPAPDVPMKSPAWRTYYILLYRYVQQLTQDEVANQLGISHRQLGREQAAALEALALRLWDTIQPVDQQGEAGHKSEPLLNVDATTGDDDAGELNWLKDVHPDEPTDLGQSLSEALSLAEPLSTRYQARMELVTQCGSPGLSIHPVAIRQILLSLLSLAIQQTPGGTVLIKAETVGAETRISIQGRRQDGPAVLMQADDPGLTMARTLAKLSGGHLDFSNDDGFAASITLPAFTKLDVLAIDDNQDILLLMQRFTAGTRYRLTGIRNPQQLVDLAQACRPCAILLDIMMPEIDGWQLLASLRRHPLVGDIPIVVCTIVAQEELAYSLGARGFIRKPVSRESLLAALDQIVEEQGIAPR